MKPSIFLSHNINDKPFARRLATDLKLAGAKIWFDEAEIKLGDSLIAKIEDGIDSTDYLGVVLSPDAVASSWVQKEVEIALNKEISGKRVTVLPLLYRECKLPIFLVGKKYADFRLEKNYYDALNEIKDRLGLEVADYSEKRPQLPEDERRAFQIMMHETITPLAAIFHSAENLLYRGNLDPRNKMVIEDIREFSKVSSFQLRQYELLRSFQGGKYPLNLEFVPDVAKFLQGLVSSQRRKFKSRNLRIEITKKYAERITLKFDKYLIELALRNLFDNAYKYSYEKTIITVGTAQKKNFVEIWIGNEGVEVKDEDVPTIFEQGGRSENAKYVSIGLGYGLYLVNLIASAHGGEIQFKRGQESDQNIFVLRIPKEY